MTNELWHYLSQHPQHSQLTERRLRRIADVIEQRQRGLMMMMEDVHDPHNLAAIARSCDAFGVQRVAFSLQNEDLFDPTETTIKLTSSGANKWLDYHIFEAGTDVAMQALQQAGWHIAATLVDARAQSIYDVDFARHNKLVLLVGNEHAGISPTAIDHADSFVYLPMHGMVESFNVSVAAALSLFEITRQRQASRRDFRLPIATQRALADAFIERTLTPRNTLYTRPL
jgi:tRNA (guanosine-2'-O-)-methyltransferase